MDLLAWDLGEPDGVLTTNKVVFDIGNFLTNTSISVVHPMKGPMMTQTLRGLNGLDPFHWRGDRTNFTHFNMAFSTLLGGSSLSDADINAFRDFINTIQFEPNPNQNLDRTLPTSLPNVAGNPRIGFTNFAVNTFIPGTSCTTCHQLPNGSGRFIVTAMTLGPGTNQDFKVPHLRNVYQKLNFNPAPGASSIGGFGLSHDGSFTDPLAFFTKIFFVGLPPDRRTNLNAYLRCFDTGTAPAVGHARSLAATNVTTTDISNDWTLLESQAAMGTNINLIVKGTLNGQHHGFLYQPLANNYKPDSTNFAAFSRAQLVAKVQTGDTLMIMGVPPGSGERMAIDRDANGVLDADEPLPRLQIAQVSGKAVLNWPLGAVGFLLEESPSLGSPIWSADTNAVDIVNNLNFITNALPKNEQFFRLRQP
ncbi:MAG: hypothetical protein WDM80_07285 [Limisphaerales bacterium]